MCTDNKLKTLALAEVRQKLVSIETQKLRNTFISTEYEA